MFSLNQMGISELSHGDKFLRTGIGKERLDYLSHLSMEELHLLVDSIDIEELLDGFSAQEIAEFLEKCPETLRNTVINEMQADGLFGDMDSDETKTVLTSLSKEERIRMINEMDPAHALEFMSPKVPP